ncbi:MAG: rRNA maturation RNase YbeY [Pseudomonadota bacterium]
MNQTRTELAPLTVDVAYVVEDRAGVPDSDSLHAWCERALALSRPPDGPADIAVRIVGTDESRQLNRQFRQRDAATNVLSFPSGMTAPPPGEALPLGDLVVCAPLVVSEAAAQDKPPHHHWCHLIVHGTLHLVGYDHQTADEARQMAGLECQVLEFFEIPDPYQFTPTVAFD